MQDKICYYTVIYPTMKEVGQYMSFHTPRFPDYFPKHCPPVEATDDECTLFRLCQGKAPVEDDFISFYQKNPQKYAGHIQAYGLSVFPSKDDCERARKKSSLLRNKYKFCATGMNTGERGKTLATPNEANPAHITWWIYEGVKPHTFFVNCDEGGGDGE